MGALSAAPSAIHLCQVTKTYGTGNRAVTALRGVNLDLRPGQLVMLAGPSGCGKTTLVSIITGILSPTSGDVEVFGTRWSQLSKDEQTRRRGELIGYVFQQFHLIPSLTVQLNVAVALLARGMPRRQAWGRAAEQLEKVGLGRWLHALPQELSGGMQQRVALARALVGHPRLLVCDEPTANLDSETGQTVMELIQAASRGTDDQGRPRSVLVVTHDWRCLRFADLIFQMEDGRVQPASAQFLVRVWQAAIAHDDAADLELQGSQQP